LKSRKRALYSEGTRGWGENAKGKKGIWQVEMEQPRYGRGKGKEKGCAERFWQIEGEVMYGATSTQRLCDFEKGGREGSVIKGIREKGGKGGGKSNGVEGRAGKITSRVQSC